MSGMTRGSPDGTAFAVCSIDLDDDPRDCRSGLAGTHIEDHHRPYSSQRLVYDWYINITYTCSSPLSRLPTFAMGYFFAL